MPAVYQYPKFITDHPDGKDLYEGRSQSRLAENIGQFLRENQHNNKKVIGIEGEWGSGKSNVIAMLDEKLKNDYYFFIFDAWGHQEDLTRRSILEGLLKKLIDARELDGDKSKWETKLKNLLARTVEKEQTNIPQFSTAVILSIVGLLIIPVTKFLAETYLKAHTSITPGIVTPGFGDYAIATGILTLSFLPLLIFFLYSAIKTKNGSRLQVVKELFYIYKGKEIKNTSHETISENEPTVAQFSDFLKDLEAGTEKKLVIVFDNMDRLPEAKVKEIWSSVHTFFASQGNIIRSWAIVPFDNAHISGIFNNGEIGGTKNYADSYIHKTFSVVFHVPPPVLSDWKSFFTGKFKEAFGIEPPRKEFLETIIDYHYIADPKIKPRDLIYFINDLVSLRKLWPEVPFRYLALFSLKRPRIMENPFDMIISKAYLEKLSEIFKYDAQLDTFMAALCFNVPTEKADEVLLNRLIRSALFGEGDIITLSTHKHFFTVMDSVFYSEGIPFDKIVICLEGLPENIQVNPKMNNYWDNLAYRIQNAVPFLPYYIDPIKTLSKRLIDKELAMQVLKTLFKNAIKLDNSDGKVFAGKKYFELIVDIDNLLKEIAPDQRITTLLPLNKMAAFDYLDFIEVCPDSYENFHVECNMDEINAFLVTTFEKNQILNYEVPLSLLKDKNLSGFKDYVQVIIESLNVADAKFHERIVNICKVGKILSIDGKQAFIVPEAIALAALNAFGTADPNAVDLLLFIMSASIPPLKPYASNTPVKKMLGSILYLEKFKAEYSYYCDYADLVRYYLQSKDPLIKFVLIDLTKSDKKMEGSDIVFLVSRYPEIKETIFDNDTSLAVLFLTKINNFYSSGTISLVDENTLGYTNEIIADAVEVDLPLINDINDQANGYLQLLNRDRWYDSFKELDNSKNITLFKILQKNGKLNAEKLPEAAFEGFSEVTTAISKKEFSIPGDIATWNMLLDYMNGNPVPLYKNVRDELLHYNHTVTFAELIFFEKGLFKFGKLNESTAIADDVLRRILIPFVSADKSYIRLLGDNMPVINEITDKAVDGIVNFKNALEQEIPGDILKTSLHTIYETVLEKLKKGTKKK